jgi:hypothetical protein
MEKEADRDMEVIISGNQSNSPFAVSALANNG